MEDENAIISERILTVTIAFSSCGNVSSIDVSNLHTLLSGIRTTMFAH